MARKVRKKEVDHHKQSPLHRSIHAQLPSGDYYTYAEAAPMIGRTADTIRKWVRSGLIDPPSYHVMRGSLEIALFTPRDIKRFIAFKKRLRTGPRSEMYVQSLLRAGKE